MSDSPQKLDWKYLLFIATSLLDPEHVQTFTHHGRLHSALVIFRLFISVQLLIFLRPDHFQ